MQCFSRKVVLVFNRDALKSFRLKLLKSEYFNAKFLSLYISSFILIIFSIATIIPFYRDNSLAKENDKIFDPNEASTLSLALSSNTISLAINPTALGSFDSSSITATVSTNNSTGYNLTMSADTTTLTNTSTDNNNESINHTIPTLLSDKDNDNNPFTCTAATSTTCNFPSGYYGYKIGTESTDYLPVSTSATSIRNTDAAISDDTTDIVLGAKLNASTAAGQYSGVNLTFIATTNLVPYNIQYNAGNITEGESVTNLPSPDTGNVDPSGTAITVSSTTPSRDGYEFVSWCTVMPTTSGDSDVCTDSNTVSGTTYAPSATFTLYPTDDTGITLYAMWAEAVSLYMQDMTRDILRDLIPNVNDTIILKDKRDGQEYNVARLADGRWWMTKNINITGGTILDTINTDVTESYILNMGGVSGLTVDTTNMTITLPASSPNGFLNNDMAYVFNNSCTSDASYCGYYSWIAATLGGKDASGTNVTGNGPDAVASICPKGWKLPTSGNYSDSSITSITGYKKGDFYKLAIQYGLSPNNYTQNDSSFYKLAGPNTLVNFLLGGYFSIGTQYGAGNTGNYWSASSATSSYAFSFHYSNSGVNLANQVNRYEGMSVRCVFDDSLYMQDMTQETMDILMPTTESSNVLLDKRDNQVYTIARLKDGKYWMTKNLNLAGGTVLTPEDTDFTYSYLNNFTTSNNLTKTTSGTIGIQLPASSTSGFNTNNYSYVYNSGNAGTITDNKVTATCASSTPCFSYYSWDAATLGSGRTISTEGQLAQQSICPKGWKLPSSNVTSPYTSDFFSLATAYGMSADSLSQSTTSFNSQAGSGKIANFLRSGYYSSTGLTDGGSFGDYWSSASTLNNSTARYFYFSSSYVNTANGLNRNYGMAVRCLFDTSSSSSSSLYNAVASQSKGNFDMSTINTTLTTDNSGVYRYTGTNSDNNSDGTSGTKDIYFYRGIIDNEFASGTGSSAYGSSGDGTLYPNYVKLTTNGYTTCWRIFRTTASGGVKMLYNGLWTGSTCANAGTAAPISGSAYYNQGTPESTDYQYNTLGRVAYVGYNFNGTYGYNNTTSSVVLTSTLFNNGTASNARTQLEGWYDSVFGLNYSYLTQNNAGYCNDRTAYTTDSASASPVTQVIPYKISSSFVGFGSRQRLYYAQTPALSCPNTTGFDLLDSLGGTSGRNRPVALITADEAVLAGNGIDGKEAYSDKSFLSGIATWTLSPSYRQSTSGGPFVFYLNSNLVETSVWMPTALRPAVSLASGTTILAGSGTAADPWVVQQPSLKVNFDSGVSSVAVKSGSASGTTVATVATSGTEVKDLDPATTYYLVPTYGTDRGLGSWANDSGSAATLSCTSDDSCSTTAAPSVTVALGSVNSVTLTSKFAGTYIQDFTLSQCQAEASSADKTVYDKRDGKTYTVRFINDACWMTQNLAYTGTPDDDNGKMTLNTDTSNIDANKTLTYGDLTSGNSYDEARLHVGTTGKTGTGAWYNFAAASAGYITGSSNSNANSYDICPKNWRMPTYSEQSGITSYSSAFSPIYGGYYNNGSLLNATTRGYWWSATAVGSTSRYYLYYSSGSLSTNYDGIRDFWFYVRCVRTNDGYMQDMTSDKLAALMPTTESTATLVDKRDNQQYTVAKLKDGKYWMTKNLNLAGGTTLTSADTNVTDTYISNMGTIRGLTVNTANKTITLPSSSSAGFYDDSTAYVYNSGSTTCASSSPCYSYYSWPAATLGGKTENGTNVATDNTDAPFSICPKGWRLPNTRTGTDSTADFRALIIALGGTSTRTSYTPSSTPTGATLSNLLTDSINNFVYGGYYTSTNGSTGDHEYGGERAYYHTSTSYDSTDTRFFYFYDTRVYLVDNGYKSYGRSVRCLFAG